MKKTIAKLISVFCLAAVLSGCAMTPAVHYWDGEDEPTTMEQLRETVGQTVIEALEQYRQQMIERQRQLQQQREQYQNQRHRT
jgi:TolA-binding protein